MRAPPPLSTATAVSGSVAPAPRAGASPAASQAGCSSSRAGTCGRGASVALGGRETCRAASRPASAPHVAGRPKRRGAHADSTLKARAPAAHMQRARRPDCAHRGRGRALARRGRPRAGKGGPRASAALGARPAAARAFSSSCATCRASSASPSAPPSRRRSDTMRSAAPPCTSGGSWRTTTLPLAYTPSSRTNCEAPGRPGQAQGRRPVLPRRISRRQRCAGHAGAWPSAAAPTGDRIPLRSACESLCATCAGSGEGQLPHTPNPNLCRPGPRLVHDEVQGLAHQRRPRGQAHGVADCNRAGAIRDAVECSDTRAKARPDRRLRPGITAHTRRSPRRCQAGGRRRTRTLGVERGAAGASNPGTRP